MRRQSLFVALLVVVLGADVALPRAALGADADRLASEGLRLRREGKDQDALPLFQEALRLQPTARAFAQLGICEQALGLWALAEGHLLEALKQTDDAWIRKNAAALRGSLEFVSGKLGTIEVWGSPAGARISLDGQPVGTLPLPKPLRAAEGRRILMAEAPSFIADTRTISVRAGALSREHVALVPAGLGATAATASSTTPAADSPSTARMPPVAALASAPPGERGAEVEPAAAEWELPTWRRVLPWSLLAAAVAAGSIGLWQQLQSGQALDRFEAIPACGEGLPMRGADPRCAGIYDDFSSARTRAYIGYGVAGLLGAGAVTSFILNATARSPGGDGTHSVALGPGGAGISYSYSLHF